jgi:hypothetical protein
MSKHVESQAGSEILNTSTDLKAPAQVAKIKRGEKSGPPSHQSAHSIHQYRNERESEQDFYSMGSPSVASPDVSHMKTKSFTIAPAVDKPVKPFEVSFKQPTDNSAREETKYSAISPRSMGPEHSET